MGMNFKAIALALGAMLLAACGSGAAEKAPATVSASAAQTESTQSPEPTADPEPEASLLGDEVDLTAVRASVLQYKKSVPPAETADSGKRWDAALIKLCNVKFEDPDEASVVFSWSSWQLRDDDDGSYDATTITYRQFPSPEFPNGDPIAVDRCAKGWVVFPVTKNARIKQVAFSVGGEDQNLWTITN